MKKLVNIKVIGIILLLFGLGSCNDDDRFDESTQDLNSGFIQFSNASTAIGGVVDSLDPDLEIPEVESVYVEVNVTTFTKIDIDYVITPVSGVSPADLGIDLSGQINASNDITNRFYPINFDTEIASEMAENTADIVNSVFDISLVRVESENGSVSIGIEGSNRPIVHRVTLRICPSNFARVNGNLVYQGEILDAEAASAAVGSTWDVELIPITETSWIIDSAWGPNFVGIVTNNPGFNNQFVYPAIITLDAENNLIINGTEGYSNFFVDVDDDESIDTINGNQSRTDRDVYIGSYDPCLNQFTYTLNQSLFTGQGGDFQVQVQLIGQ